MRQARRFLRRKPCPPVHPVGQKVREVRPWIKQRRGAWGPTRGLRTPGTGAWSGTVGSRRQAGRPGGPAAVEVLHALDAEGGGIMTEYAMEHPALAVMVQEGHRVVPPVDLRGGLGQDVDRAVAIEAGVQL